MGPVSEKRPAISLTRISPALVLGTAGAVLALAAFANAFVMPQTQPRLEAAAKSLIPALPWWSWSRSLAVLVPDSARMVAAAAAGLQVLGFAGYVVGIVIAWRAKPTRIRIAVVVGVTVLAWTFMTAALPTMDTDIFSYIAQGRVAAVHHANPEIVPPAAFPADPVVAFVSPEYRGIPGDNKLPLWSDVTAGIAEAAANSPAAALLDYRVLFLAIDLATLGLIAFLLGRLAPARLLAGLVIYGWNPIVVETGQSKTDTLMVCLVLLSLCLLAVGWRRLAVASLVGSVLVKLISLPLLVVQLGGYLRRREWGWFAESVAIALAVGGLVYLPFWAGPNEVVSQVGLLGGGGSLVPAVIRPLAIAAFAMIIVWLIRRDDGSLPQLVRSWTIVSIFFGAVLTAPGLSWYLLTMIALAAVCSDGGLVAIAVVISFVSLAFDHVQRFELSGPIAVSRGAIYLAVAGAAAAAVIVAIWLGRAQGPRWPGRHAA